MNSESVSGDAGPYRELLCAAEVRRRCHLIGEMAMNGNASWFTVNESRIRRCVSLVRETCLKHYPGISKGQKIPLHSRWRHFMVNDTDLWKHYTHSFSGDRIDFARSAVDLVFLSVLLDAGAGEKWRYHDPVTGTVLCRSEGLAAASIDLFFNLVAREDGNKGWVLDVQGLEGITRDKLGLAFQSSRENPLSGLSGRAELLQGLATALDSPGNRSAGYTRPGSIIDECLDRSTRSLFSKRQQVDITEVLEIVLTRFGSIWPDGYRAGGNNLGDCGYYSTLEIDGPTQGIVPFHKLSQWLTYSLIEPLQWAGLKVVNLDGLTGLPEYRNGGLLIDTGVLQPQDPELMNSILAPDCEAVVEWRALTVYMLDRIAADLRKSLKLSPKHLPLSSVLQGGTWAAGRELAARLREDSSPPLKLAINGTVF